MLPRKHNAGLVSNAKDLRRNMTKEERHLWYDFLRAHPARFTRQKVLGRYVADFYSAAAKLVIELDGSQHFEEEGAEKDAERTLYLERYGLKVLRIPNGGDNPSVTFGDSSPYTGEPWIPVVPQKPPLCKGRWHEVPEGLSSPNQTTNRGCICSAMFSETRKPIPSHAPPAFRPRCTGC